jgi:DNA-binding transcriptional regulator GbsR (MarR family)
LGSDDKSISTIDPSGIALAAIKELYSTQKQLEAKTEEVDDLKSKMDEMTRQMDKLYDLVSDLSEGR